MNDIIIEQLIDNIKETNKDKSSHWKNYLNKKINIQNQFDHFGAGAFTKKSYKDIFHLFLQKIVFGNQIFKTETYKKYKAEFNYLNRAIDNDAIRHIFIFEKLKKIISPKKIGIIGDGKLNAVLGAHLTFPEAQIFDINLSEVLINNYVILKKSRLELKNSIEFVNNLNFQQSNKKIYLVPSNLKNFLLNKNIDFFINIASFQEMNMREINKYFTIIKNNRSQLYCCNREYKKLIGNEEIYFRKYPWEKSKKIFWENCPWHKKFYTLKPPFIYNYEGNSIHCLVDFS